MNQVLSVIEERSSLRRYADKPISPEDKHAILHSALRAPTAGNMMLYSIIDVTDQAKKDFLAKSCDNQPFIAKAPMVLVFVLDFSKWYEYYRVSGVPQWCEEVGKDMHYPQEGEFLLAANDAIIAAQNAVIAAESLGIGSCYIGDIMEHYETHRDLFNLPDLAFPVTMLTFGHYPEGMERVKRDRYDAKYVVFENEYQQLTDAELLAMNETKKYPEKEENFGLWMYKRKNGTDFMDEMSRSVRAGIDAWNSHRKK